jgi:hypothetical protein
MSNVLTWCWAFPSEEFFVVADHFLLFEMLPALGVKIDLTFLLTNQREEPLEVNVRLKC